MKVIGHKLNKNTTNKSTSREQNRTEQTLFSVSRIPQTGGTCFRWSYMSKNWFIIKKIGIVVCRVIDRSPTRQEISQDGKKSQGRIKFHAGNHRMYILFVAQTMERCVRAWFNLKKNNNKACRGRQFKAGGNHSKISKSLKKKQFFKTPKNSEISKIFRNLENLPKTQKMKIWNKNKIPKILKNLEEENFKRTKITYAISGKISPSM